VNFYQTTQRNNPEDNQFRIRRCDNLKSLITLMKEAASTSEMSVNFYQTTRRNNPEDSQFRIRRCEYLKSHSSP
jgi:hypothetical protein